MYVESRMWSIINMYLYLDRPRGIARVEHIERRICINIKVCPRVA